VKRIGWRASFRTPTNCSNISAGCRLFQQGKRTPRSSAYKIETSLSPPTRRGFIAAYTRQVSRWSTFRSKPRQHPIGSVQHGRRRKSLEADTRRTSLESPDTTTHSTDNNRRSDTRAVAVPTLLIHETTFPKNKDALSRAEIWTLQPQAFAGGVALVCVRS